MISEKDLGKQDKMDSRSIHICIFSFITVSDFSVNSPELGFLAYFTNILQGMPPYIKTDDSVFTIPVSWFCFMHFIFMVGFYPLSDLYGAGKRH